MAQHQLIVGTLVLVFFFLVAFQPMLSDLTKGGADDIPYIESTVICAEAIVSTILGQVVSRRFLKFRDILRYFPIGLLRAVEDTLSLVCLNYIDPSLYVVLAQSRLVLTGISSSLLLKDSPNKLQFQHMGTITTVLVAFTLSYQGPGTGSNGSSSTFGILLAGIAVTCKVAASVYLEKQVKNDDMPVVLQSAAISASTIVPALAYGLAFDHDHVQEQGLLGGWSWLTIAVLVLILAKNWLSNVIVKRWSAVVKYVIYAAAVAGTYVLQRLWYGEPWSPVSCILCGILMLAVYGFAEGKNWEPKAPVSGASAESTASATEDSPQEPLASKDVQLPNHLAGAEGWTRAADVVVNVSADEQPKEIDAAEHRELSVVSEA